MPININLDQLNPNNLKKDARKKNVLATDSSNQDGSILHHQEEKEMTKIFHIKIWVMNTKIDSSLDSIS
jgi:hypothetical protein